MAGDEVTVSVTVTVNGVSTAVTDAEIRLTAAPANSALVVGDAIVDAAGEPSLVFNPDVPGDYAFDVTRYVDNTVAPAFDGGVDPYIAALDVETFTVYVGQAMTLPIVTALGSLTLTIVTSADEVASATLSGATTDRALYASLDATVATKLAALNSVSVSSLGPALPADVGELGLKIDAHFRNATAHPTGGGYAADSVNVYSKSAPVDQSDAINKLNEIRAVYLHHALDSTTSGIHWHNSSDDTKNVPIAQVATTLAGAVVLYADMWRSYEAHRVQTAGPAVHAGADATNTLSTIDPLSDLIKTVLAYMADDTPTVPAQQNQASVEAAALYGFS